MVHNPVGKTIFFKVTDGSFVMIVNWAQNKILLKSTYFFIQDYIRGCQDKTVFDSHTQQLLSKSLCSKTTLINSVLFAHASTSVVSSQMEAVKK